MRTRAASPLDGVWQSRLATAKDEHVGVTIVLYTDGLVESRVEPLEDGLRALTELLRAAPTDRADGIADHLVSGMNRGHGNGLDDVALLVLRWDEGAVGTDARSPATAAPS